MAVSPKDKALVRSHIKNLLSDIPFILYVREPPLVDGSRRYGVQKTIRGSNDRTKALIWLSESIVKQFADVMEKREQPVSTQAERAGAFAMYVIWHESAHALQDTLYADLYEKHFAPHGTHESEQFANALASALGTREYWGGYHPPTFEQAALVESHIDRCGGAISRRLVPTEPVSRTRYPKGSYGAAMLQHYAPDNVCQECVGDSAHQ